MKKIVVVLTGIMVFIMVGIIVMINLSDSKDHANDENKFMNAVQETKISLLGTAKESDKFTAIIEMLSEYPDKMSSKVFPDDTLVIVHGAYEDKLGLIDHLLLSYQEKVATKLLIVQYTIEGDPILTQLHYDGELFYGVIDNTRDDFGSPYYRLFEFPILKTFSDRSYMNYVLFQEDIDVKDYLKSLKDEDYNRYEHLQLFAVDE